MTQRRALAAALALGLAAAGYVTYAYAAGSWSQLPQVGAAADSSGLVTIPAGPTALTGAEVVPADTNLSAGAPPQTVRVPVMLLGGGPWAWETHPTTGSITIVSNSVGSLFLTTASAAKTGPTSIQLPSAPVDNQRFQLSTDRALTGGVFFSPNTGQSVNGGVALGGSLATGVVLSSTAATTTAGASSVTLVYRLSNTTWYRIQ